MNKAINIEAARGGLEDLRLPPRLAPSWPSAEEIRATCHGHRALRRYLSTEGELRNNLPKEDEAIWQAREKVLDSSLNAWTEVGRLMGDNLLGPVEWARCFQSADFGSVPPFPERVAPRDQSFLELLISQCPLSRAGVKVKDSHLLVFMAKNGVEAELIAKQAHAPSPPHHTKYQETLGGHCVMSLGKPKLPEGSWLLMPKDPGWPHDKPLPANYRQATREELLTTMRVVIAPQSSDQLNQKQKGLPLLMSEAAVSIREKLSGISFPRGSSFICSDQDTGESVKISSLRGLSLDQPQQWLSKATTSGPKAIVRTF